MFSIFFKRCPAIQNMVRVLWYNVKVLIQFSVFILPKSNGRSVQIFREPAGGTYSTANGKKAFFVETIERVLSTAENLQLHSKWKKAFCC